jgi:hypothetical protein
MYPTKEISTPGLEPLIPLFPSQTFQEQARGYPLENKKTRSSSGTTGMFNDLIV